MKNGGFFLFRKWLRTRHKEITLFIICCGCAVAVALLSGQSVKIMLYILLLCAYFAVCFSVYDFVHFRREHIKISEAIRCIEDVSVFSVSYAGLIGEDCTELIQALSANTARLSAEMRKRETEAMDYYTLWTHQIKTPIAAMQLMLDSGEPDIALLKAELFKIERYTEMALGYIRLESMSDDMVLNDCDIHSVAASALRSYFPLFSTKKLSLDFEEFTLHAVTDEKWMSFVIGQLLSNSIKYTRKGGISIYAKGKVLYISDTGSGIAQDDLPRIFERGFTGYNGRMDKKATGLGLYLCRKITAKLGHTLAVSSEKGKGTVVSVDFTQDSAK